MQHQALLPQYKHAGSMSCSGAGARGRSRAGVAALEQPPDHSKNQVGERRAEHIVKTSTNYARYARHRHRT
eukprot:1846309-Pleurochrysis_carterae.AAC.1